MTADDLPAAGSAEVHVLNQGYVGLDGDGERVSGTVTVIIDCSDAIVFSHHHPDHTVNAALFPAARIHDHWAVYEADRWVDRDAHGMLLSPSVRLLRTPGHTAEDISTAVATAEGVCVCTHAWWSAEGPEDDPLATDTAALAASREFLLSFATVIIPGHGAPFRPASALARPRGGSTV